MKTLRGKLLKKTKRHVPIVGSTTCCGVMTENGQVTDDDHVIGLWGIVDPEGVYVEGMVNYDMSGTDVRTAVEYMVKGMMAKAPKRCIKLRPLPDFIWFSSAPGTEEGAVTGIQAATSDTTPVVGGSSADNTVEGKWWQLSSQDPVRTYNGMAICLCWPSVLVKAAFYSGLVFVKILMFKIFVPSSAAQQPLRLSSIS